MPAFPCAILPFLGRIPSCDRRHLKQVVEGDEFTRRLLDLHTSPAAPLPSPLPSAFRAAPPAALGLYRYDYFMQDPPPPGAPPAPTLCQVELNTMAASFGCLGARVRDVHALTIATGLGPPGATLDDLPANDAEDRLAAGLAAGHAAYIADDRSRGLEGGLPALPVVVVQPGERNVYDQMLLGLALLRATDGKVPLQRLSLAQLAAWGTVDPATNALVVRLPTDETSAATVAGEGSQWATPITAYRVSVAYFRAGYTPNDYPTDAEWAARTSLHASDAIAVPTVGVQLVGTKKVQQVLTAAGEVERYLEPGDAAAVRATFMPQLSLAPGAEGDANAATAIADANSWVLKPQREGGGNNLYGADVAAALRRMDPVERGGWVLMRRILPVRVPNVVVRAGVGRAAEVVCELGVFGIYLAQAGGEVTLNEASGTLLRSKLADVEDGGVAAGVAVLDSVRLVR